MLLTSTSGSFVASLSSRAKSKASSKRASVCRDGGLLGGRLRPGRRLMASTALRSFWKPRNHD